MLYIVEEVKTSALIKKLFILNFKKFLEQIIKKTKKYMGIFKKYRHFVKKKIDFFFNTTYTLLVNEIGTLKYFIKYIGILK